MKKIVLIFFLLFSMIGFSQTTYDWSATAPDGNWTGTVGERWFGDGCENGCFDEPPSTSILKFDNDKFPNMTNNVPGIYEIHKIIFTENAFSTRTISGNNVSFKSSGGLNPYIENISAASNIINIGVLCDGNPLEVNTANGNLTFTNIISGTGGITKTGPRTLILSATSGNNTTNTYAGATIINTESSGTINVTGLANITSTAITSVSQSVNFISATPPNGTYQLLPGLLTVTTQSFTHNANPIIKVVTFNYTNSTVTVSDPSITTNTITPTAYCLDATVSVPYSSSGTFAGTYTAQLSDATGSFTSPTAIGSGASSPIIATIPSNTPTGTGYRIRVVNSSPIVTGTDNGVNITINAVPSTPTITGLSTFCGSSTTLTSSADTGNQWYINGNLIAGATSKNLLVTAAGTYTVTSSVPGCTSAPSIGKPVIAADETFWNGTTWSNGDPDGTKPVRISSNYTIGADLIACSLTVDNNAVVTVSPLKDVTLYGPLTVSPGSSFTLENNASLIQNTSEINSGNIKVKRNSSTLMRLDYTIWSSPVASQNLYGFSPQTLTNRFYTYNQTNNLYSLNDMYQSGTPAALSSSSTFQVGRGYLIRAPNNHPTTPTTWTGQFIGVPNNGTISVPLTKSSGDAYGYNLVGNPYPSPISAETFLSQNSSLISSTLWFWVKTNGTLGSAYSTLISGTPSNPGTGPGQASESGDSYIQQGQGFFVKATTSGNLQFTNQQRLGIVDTFYRTNVVTTPTAPAIGRVWLHLKSNDVVVGSMAIGYKEGATNNLDEAFDGKYINDSPLALTSFVQGQELSVQHRAIPFTATDSVPLSFKTDIAGSYAIAINTFDGLFSNGQTIYLKDNLTGTVHNLNVAPYSFAATVGTFTSRFEIVYQSALSVNAPTFSSNQVIIYKNAVNDFVINSGNVIMASVKVFDIRGRLLQESTAINASQTTITAGLSNEVLLVQITSEDGLVVTKKIIR